MSRYSQERFWSDVRVGGITFAGVFLLVFGVVFAGGDKGLLFQKTSFVQARLADVGGLKKGSSVTMGGMTIGRVTNIGFARADLSNQIEVTLEIRAALRKRIKTDSVPAVRTQGMLGDRYIDISMGTEGAAELSKEAPLVGGGASDFDKTLQQANEVLGETEKLLAAVNAQQGTVGRLVYDEMLYKTLTEISTELRDLIKDFKKHPRKYVKFSLI